METPEIYYKRVYIENQDDLPKEDGEYFVHYRKYEMGSTHIYLGNLAREYTWLKDIDWYLLPIESKEITPLTDEMIEEWADKVASNSVGDFDTAVIIKAALMLGARANRDGKIK